MILPLEQQVCSLESAKRLKELGFPQESLFIWRYVIDAGDNTTIPTKRDLILQQRTILDKYDSEVYSAYTVAELGILLPQKWALPSRIPENRIKEFGGEWQEVYEHCAKYSSTESEARAKMLIYLAENGLITVDTKGDEI